MVIIISCEHIYIINNFKLLKLLEVICTRNNVIGEFIYYKEDNIQVENLIYHTYSRSKYKSYSPHFQRISIFRFKMCVKSYSSPNWYPFDAYQVDYT